MLIGFVAVTFFRVLARLSKRFSLQKSFMHLMAYESYGLRIVWLKIRKFVVVCSAARPAIEIQVETFKFKVSNQKSATCCRSPDSVV